MTETTGQNGSGTATGTTLSTTETETRVPLTAPVLKDGSDDLRPMVAEWMHSWTGIRTTVWKWVRRNNHRLWWHAIRLPLYAGKLAVRSPIGLYITLRSLVRFLSDAEAHELRIHVVGRKESPEYRALRKQRNEAVRNRLIVTGILAGPPALAVIALFSTQVAGALIGLVIGALVLALTMDLRGLAALLALPFVGWFAAPGLIDDLPEPPWWITWPSLLLLLLVLGWTGWPKDRKLTQTATVIDGAPPKPSEEFIRRALTKLGIVGMTEKTADQVRFLGPVKEDKHGNGWGVGLELPAGITVEKVQEKRAALASALGRELGCTWPEQGKRHPGHLKLYVSDVDMRSGPQPAWPLLKSTGVDLFEPIPLFTNARGDWVTWKVGGEGSGIVGGLPRVGKTVFVRDFALVAGMDVRAKVYIIDLKGGSDYNPCALFAHFFSVGDEDDEIARQLSALRALREDMRRRYKTLREIAKDEETRHLVPDSKVTTELASTRKHKLEPAIVITDEVQVWFEHKEHGAEFIEIATDLVKRGPAVGIGLFMSTQRPDATAIPTGLADNCAYRVCFKVMKWEVNDKILGTGAYSSGIRATMLSREDKGICYVALEDGSFEVCRTVYLNATESEKVAKRIRQMREKAMRLTGDAADEAMETEEQQIELREDLLQLVGQAKGGALEDLAGGLSALRPVTYGQLDSEAVGKLGRGIGLTVETFWLPSKRKSVKGFLREHLENLSTTAELGEPETNGHG